MKCSDHLHCWYCSKRCNVCLEPSAFGATVERDGTRWSFCSEQCQSLLSLGSEGNNFQAFDAFDNPPHVYSHTSAVSDDHRELAYIFFQYTSSEEGYGYFDSTLSLGDAKQEGGEEERVYCVMYFRGLQQQFLLGFYLAANQEPKLDDTSGPLSYFFPSEVPSQLSSNDVSFLVANSLDCLHCESLNALVKKHQN